MHLFVPGMLQDSDSDGDRPARHKVKGISLGALLLRFQSQLLPLLSVRLRKLLSFFVFRFSLCETMRIHPHVEEIDEDEVNRDWRGVVSTPPPHREQMCNGKQCVQLRPQRRRLTIHREFVVSDYRHWCDCWTHTQAFI